MVAEDQTASVRPDDLTRDEFDLGTEHTDDLDARDRQGRFYFDPTGVPAGPTLDEVFDHSPFVSPSVTTILNFREDAEKDEAIDGWKSFYDGTASHRSPHWSDQQSFKQYRGTLAHYAVLSQIAELERGEEEREAEECLRYWFRHAPQADIDDVPDDVLDAAETYWVCLRKGDTTEAARKQAEGGHQVDLQPHLSRLDNQYDGVRAWEKAMREVNTVCRLFQKHFIHAKDLDEGNIVTVEEYAVMDEPVAYAGQADLVYENGDDTILADLKTSGKVRHDYKLQLGAYAVALPYDIDHVEVVSLDPDDETVAIETNDDWNRNIDSLSNEFLGLTLRTREHLTN